MKRILSMIAAAALVLSTTACSSAASSSAGAASGAAAGKDPADCKVGVIQLAEHVALDAAREGFVDALVEAGYKEENIEVQNAQGEIPNCATIATKFVNDKVDLILAIATPAAQAAAQATQTIPILATAVTDFGEAGLVDSDEAPGGNVTGTSDMNPIDDQAELLVKVCPDAKTVGILYCSAEDNSKLQAALMHTALEAKGLKVEEYTAADVNDIQPVTTKACGTVDALYIPTDNLFAANMPTVALVSEPAKIPVICGESGMVESGGTITKGLDYYTLGKLAAGQAVEILQLGVDPATIPVGFASGDDLKLAVNQENVAAIGLELPAEFR